MSVPAKNLDQSVAGAAARLGNAWHDGENLIPFADLAGELSDEQRAGVLAFFAERPGGGFKAALRKVGIRATTRQARDLLLNDEQVKDVRLGHFGLDEKTILTTLGAMVGDLGHKDCFNATRLAGGVLHGLVERSGVDVSGNVEVTNTDVADAIERFTAAVVHASERRGAELAAGGSD